MGALFSRLTRCEREAFHEEYCAVFTTVHDTFRRAFANLSEKLEEHVRDRGEKELPPCLQEYARLLFQALRVHHTQEDRHIFPTFIEAAKTLQEASPATQESSILAEGVLSTLQEMGEQHGALDGESGVIATALAVLTCDQPTTGEQAAALLAQVRSLDWLDGHMREEEGVITPAFTHAAMPVHTLYQVHDATHALIAEFMNRKLSLVFLIYHMTDEEQAYMTGKLPFFIRWWLFPRWAVNESLSAGAVWNHAPHARKDVEGRWAL